MKPNLRPLSLIYDAIPAFPSRLKDQTKMAENSYLITLWNSKFRIN